MTVYYKCGVCGSSGEGEEWAMEHRETTHHYPVNSARRPPPEPPKQKMQCIRCGVLYDPEHPFHQAECMSGWVPCVEAVSEGSPPTP